MTKLAGSDGFQFRTQHFDVLAEITATGVASAMLPCFFADNDPRIKRTSDPILKQPLWMLYHRQDRDVHHLKAARSWIKDVARKKLPSE